MGYEKIDSVLYRWAGNHKLHWFTKYHDDEVRSTEIVDSKGNRFQLWVNPPNLFGRIGVNIWDYGKRRKTFMSSKSDLEDSLEEAYAKVNSWISENIN